MCVLIPVRERRSSQTIAYYWKISACESKDLLLSSSLRCCSRIDLFSFVRLVSTPEINVMSFYCFLWALTFVRYCVKRIGIDSRPSSSHMFMTLLRTLFPKRDLCSSAWLDTLFTFPVTRKYSFKRRARSRRDRTTYVPRDPRYAWDSNTVTWIDVREPRPFYDSFVIRPRSDYPNKF